MKLAFCTIATADKMAKVQVLEQSLFRFHPDLELQVLLCERPEICRELATKTGRRFYSPADVECEDWLQMAFYYDITEYNTALKPFFLEQLFREGYEGVFYFDPDIELYAPLNGLFELIETNDIILTPHVTRPVPNDGKFPTMDSYIRAGQFNLGFFGVRRSSAGEELLRWWQSVLLEKCILEADHRFFVDQFWADAFPSLVEKTWILRDPAYNMAYWNIFQRSLDQVDGCWLADSGRLVFFHFSGVHLADLTRVSVYQNRVTAALDSPLYRLLSEYFDRIRGQEWAVFDSHLYSFATYHSGEPITGDERRAFLSMNREERLEIGDPFGDDTIKGTIRLRCRNGQAGVEIGAERIEMLQKKVEVLDFLYNQILSSRSWKITAPLRKIDSMLAGRKG